MIYNYMQLIFTEKYAKIPKYIIPKQFHLVLHPRFDEERSNTTKDLGKIELISKFNLTNI